MKENRFLRPYLLGFLLACLSFPISSFPQPTPVQQRYVLPPAPPTAPPGSELFLVAIDTTLLSSILYQPPAKESEVDRYAKKTHVVGTALTEGPVRIKPSISSQAIAVSLEFDSTTTTRTTNTDHPLRMSQVQWDWTIVTKTLATRALFFDESGIRKEKSVMIGESAVVSSSPPEVSATGPLGGRMRRRIINNHNPPQKIADSFGEAARKTTLEVAGKIGPVFDSQSDTFLARAEKSFIEYIFNPFIKEKLLGGRLNFGSDLSWLVMQATDGGERYAVVPSQIALLKNVPTPQAPVLIRIQKELPGRIIEKRLGGTQMTEVEAAEIVGRGEDPVETYEGIVGNPREELLFTYSEERPVEFDFVKNEIQVTTRYRELVTLGKRVENVKIVRAIGVGTLGPCQLVLFYRSPKEISHFDGTPLEEKIAKHIKSRIDRSLPTTPVLLSNKVLFGSFLPMTIVSASAMNHELILGLSPLKPQPQPAAKAN